MRRRRLLDKLGPVHIEMFQGLQNGHNQATKAKGKGS